MKLTFVALLLMTQITAVAQGVLLSSGQSYVFEFSSLSYLRPAQVSDGGSFYAYFSAGTFSDGENVLVEIFQNSLSDTPLTSSYSHVGPADPLESYAIGFSWSSASMPFWPDFQGIARVTMISGDCQLDSLDVRQIVNGGLYLQSFPVPEPSPFSLGICIVASLMMVRGFRRSPPDTLTVCNY